MFDAHQIIFAENTSSESFYPGETSLQMLTPEARREVFMLFPELREAGGVIRQSYGAPVRQIAKRRELVRA